MMGVLKNKTMPADDEELIKCFLYNKIHGKPFPKYPTILECDLYGEKNPWEIWEELAESNSYGGKDLYFFTILKRKSLTAPRSRFVRTIGLGSWEGEDVGKEVKAKGTNQRIGLKKRFRFENSSTIHDGAWIMHEYTIDSSLLTNPPEHNYVLCRIRKNTRHNAQREENKAALEKRVVVLGLETTKKTANNDVEMSEDIQKRAKSQLMNNGAMVKKEEDKSITTTYHEEEEEEDGDSDHEEEQEDGNRGRLWAEEFALQLREINKELLIQEEEITMIPNPFYEDMCEKIL